MSNSQVPSLHQLCCAQLPIEALGGSADIRDPTVSAFANKMYKWFGFLRHGSPSGVNTLRHTTRHSRPTLILQRKMMEHEAHREHVWRVVYTVPSEGTTRVGLIDVGNMQSFFTNAYAEFEVEQDVLTDFLSSVDSYEAGRGHDSNPNVPIEFKWFPHNLVEDLPLPDRWTLQPPERVQQADMP